jgi:hypothetical protein
MKEEESKADANKRLITALRAFMAAATMKAKK